MQCRCRRQLIGEDLIEDPEGLASRAFNRCLSNSMRFGLE